MPQSLTDPTASGSYIHSFSQVRRSQWDALSGTKGQEAGARRGGHAGAGLILLVPAVKGGAWHTDLLQRLAGRQVRLLNELEDFAAFSEARYLIRRLRRTRGCQSERSGIT
jgi:hypothetical protein